MGQSARAVLQAVVLFVGIAAVISWCPLGMPTAAAWAMRLGTTGVTGTAGWLLWRYGRRRAEVLPDLLARTAGNYFERDGFCFAFVPGVTADGQSWMRVFFQNRFERPCRGRAVLRPPSRHLSLGRWPLPTVDVTVDCDGAAFGVYRTPWPVPAKLQGRVAKCDVAGAVRYPNGRGQMVRFRDGLRAGSAGGDLAKAALTVSMAAVGGLYVSRPARMQVKLPLGVGERPADGAAASVQILWRPDLPTGGFPVLPAAATDAGAAG